MRYFKNSIFNVISIIILIAVISYFIYLYKNGLNNEEKLNEQSNVIKIEEFCFIDAHFDELNAINQSEYQPIIDRVKNLTSESLEEAFLYNEPEGLREKYLDYIKHYEDYIDKDIEKFKFLYLDITGNDLPELIVFDGTNSDNIFYYNKKDDEIYLYDSVGYSISYIGNRLYLAHPLISGGAYFVQFKNYNKKEEMMIYIYANYYSKGSLYFVGFEKDDILIKNIRKKQKVLEDGDQQYARITEEQFFEISDICTPLIKEYYDYESKNKYTYEQLFNN